MQQLNLNFSSEANYYNTLHDNGVDLSSDKILVQLFSSITEKETLQEIAEKILRVTPNATLIGSTTAGEIFEGRMHEKSTVLAVSIFKSTTISSAYCEGIDSEVLGEELFKLLYHDNSKCMISFVDGLQHNGEIFLSGMNKHNSSLVPISGGMAADLMSFETTYTIYNNVVFSGGAVGISLSGDALEAL